MVSRRGGGGGGWLGAGGTFHDFIRRRKRNKRSMRIIRRKESLKPSPAKRAVSTISTIDMVTIDPSRTFHPSDQ